MSLLSRIFGSRKEMEPTIAREADFLIPEGDTDIEVYGDQYRNRAIRTLYSQKGSGKFLVSLTPISQYQIDKGWPNPPFINVNTHGSEETTTDNWLGYIPFGYGNKIDFARLLAKYDSIDAVARIDKRGQSFELVLMVLAENHEISVMKINIVHDDDHCNRLDKIISRGIDKINVDLSKEPVAKGKNKGKFIYRAELRGYPVGRVSVVKSGELSKYLLGSKARATISLRHYDEHRHYSVMTVSK